MSRSVLTVLCLIAILFGSTSKAFAVPISGLSGSGTEASPYLLYNLEDMKTFASIIHGSSHSSYENKYWKMKSDITLSDGGFLRYGYIEKEFIGHFDGGGHKFVITAQNSAHKDVDYMGLFGRVKNSTFKDLTIEYKNVFYGRHYSAPFIGEAEGSLSVDNVHVTDNGVDYYDSSGVSHAKFKFYSHICGGFIGKIYNPTDTVIIRRSSSYSLSLELNDDDDSGCWNAGGFIGVVEKADDATYTLSVEDCIARSINGFTFLPHYDDRCVGGFIGGLVNTSAKFSRCIADVSIPYVGQYKRGSFMGGDPELFEIKTGSTADFDECFGQESQLIGTETNTTFSNKGELQTDLTRWSIQEVYEKLNYSTNEYTNECWTVNSSGKPTLEVGNYYVKIDGEDVQSISGAAHTDGNDYYINSGADVNVYAENSENPIFHNEYLMSVPIKPSSGESYYVGTVEADYAVMRFYASGKVYTKNIYLPQAQNLEVKYYDQWENEVTLRWDYDNSNAFKGKFYVYRKLKSDEDYERVEVMSESVISAETDSTSIIFGMGDDNRDKEWEFKVAFVEEGEEVPDTPSMNAEKGVTFKAATTLRISNFSVEVSKSSIHLSAVVPVQLESTSDNDFTYSIERKVGATGVFETIASGFEFTGSGAISYTDTSPNSVCDEYFYRIVATVYGNKFNSSEKSGRITGGTEINTFTATKGEFANQVRLEWELDKLSEDLTERIKIFRKVAKNPDAEYSEIALLNTAEISSRYEDSQALPGIYYLYKLQLYQVCDGNTSEAQSKESLGFSQSTGVASGRITYGTGTSVEGVNVQVVKNNLDEEQTQFNSLYSKGEGKSMIWETSAAEMKNLLSGDFTLQFWIRPTTQNKNSVRLGELGEAISIDLVNTTEGRYILQASFQNDNDQNTPDVVSCPIDTLLTSQRFTHVSLVRSGDQVKLHLINDLNLSNVKVETGSNSLTSFDPQLVDSPVYELKMGNQFFGYLDDMRLWTKALDTLEIKQNYDRLLIGSETNLMAYWTFDEGLDDIDNIGYFFDCSREGTLFNRNHGTHSLESVATVPTSSQLALKAVTDKDGNYQIRGIPFSGEGTSYNIVPEFGIHQFSPSSQLRYISNSSLVHNGTDFEDISSFKVNGTILYKGTSYPVSNVELAIDGIGANKDGERVVTNNEGEFELDVPIGEHYISVSKYGHIFTSAHWPARSNDDVPIYHNFQDDVTLYSGQFTDSTEVTLIGKIVGGPVEGIKTTGSEVDPSKNNLGLVTFNLKTVRGYDLWENKKYVTVTTDAKTGVYKVDLIPEKFTFPDGEYPQTENSDYQFNRAEDVTEIDMSNMLTENYVIDSIFTETVVDGINKRKLLKVDTVVTYHKCRDWIWRASPELTLESKDGNPYLGDDVYEYTTSEDQKVKVPLIDNSQTGDGMYVYQYPIFKQTKQYALKIRAVERYINSDDLTEDVVPVSDGKLIVENNLAAEATNVEMDFGDSGELNYNFMAGMPAVASPFTKTINFKLKVDDEYINNAEITQNAYVFGGKSEGSMNFVTAADDIDFILRDPAGSNSYSFIENGFSVTTTSSDYHTNGFDVGIDAMIFLGPTITTATGGFGFQVESELDTQIDLGVSVNTSHSWTEEGASSETKTYNFSYETSSAPEFTGAMGDVFFGHGNNVFYGVAQNIKLIPDPDNANEYIVGNKTALVVGKQATTDFIFTQNHVENYLLPNMKTLRNALFDKVEYESKLSPSDPNYGLPNDNIAFGSAAGLVEIKEGETVVGLTGPSYTFRPASGSFESVVTDSIQEYNTKIDNWIGILSMNDSLKVHATDNFDDSNKYKNLSFDAGASVSSSITVETSDVHTKSYDFTVSAGVSAAAGAKVNGLGYSVSLETNYNHEGGKSESEEEIEVQTIGFVLADPDQGDYFSMDVLKDNVFGGPVFYLRGGQSSCPYEDTQRTKYYEPGKHEISAGTTAIEVPELNVETSLVTNVPEGNAALFDVRLSNNTTTGADVWYGLMVDAASNPEGAIVKVDGKVISGTSMQILVPAGESVEKVVALYQGENGVTNYDNINLIMHSLCQFDPTDDVADISDTIKISAQFVPTCSQVAITYPNDKWTINCNSQTNGKPVMNLTFGEYDLNSSKFTDFMFQYKPSEKSSWITVATFVKNRDADETDLAIIDLEGEPVARYTWDMSSLQNREYDLRVVSNCSNGTTYESEIVSGIFDNNAPQLWGTPQPSDGILSPNEDVMISFNEEIREGLITSSNFKVTGVLNGTDLQYQEYVLHDGSLHFDGNQQFMKVDQNLNLKYTSFSIEFWAKRERSGQRECLISHGGDGGLWVGFSEDDRFMMQLGNEILYSGETYTNLGVFTHFAVSFTRDTETNEMMLMAATGSLTDHNAKAINYSYSGSSALSVANDGVNGFKGNMHSLRIWNIPSTISTVTARRYTLSGGYETGLMGYWPMDDAEGDLAQDLAFSRHGRVNATWAISSDNYAIDCSTGETSFGTGSLGLINTADFTLEFWFKSSVPSKTESLFSSGKADVEDSKKWSVVGNANNSISVWNNGIEHVVASGKFLDNNWHHFGLVMNRRGNVTVYIDAESKWTDVNTNYTGLEAGTMVLGARTYINSSSQLETDQSFGGLLDEVRIWNSARTQELISTYKNTALSRDEMGLVAYFPFEDRTITDPSVDSKTWENMTQATLAVADKCTSNGSTFVSSGLMIKVAKPRTPISFSYVVNDNSILLVPDVEKKKIENTTLEFSAEGIYDLNGNRMESAVTWTAFVNQNQLMWDVSELSLECSPDNATEFDLTIVNKGGSTEYWSIDNLPVWLTLDKETGSLDPLTTDVVHVTVNPAINVGSYSQDIYLSGSMEYNERCTINLSVLEQAPDWNVDPTLYETSMTLIGRLQIEEELSTDVNDMVAAFIGDECRGIANVQYFESGNFYLVSLTIHAAKSESGTSEVSLKVWDASKGNLHINVTSEEDGASALSSFTYEENKIMGLVSIPVAIKTSDSVGLELAVSVGWNWLSFNLLSDQLNSSNSLLSSIKSATGDVIKSFTSKDDYVTDYGWDGKLTAENYSVNKLYKLKTSYTGTLQLSGIPLITENYPTTINPGWNWIGYSPQYKMPISSALSYLFPEQNDLIKSQSQFAMYDEDLGWIGSLSYMNPLRGYKYFSNASQDITFVYPQETLFKSAFVEEEQTDAPEGYCEENMTALAIPVGLLRSDEEDRLEAYVEGKLVGETSGIYTGEQWIYPITIGGDMQSKSIIFKIKRVNGEELVSTTSLIYQANSMIGTVSDPFNLQFEQEETQAIQVRPNPFTEYIWLEKLPGEGVDITIYDTQGRLVKQWEKIVERAIKWDGTNTKGLPVEAGIYLIKVDGETSSSTIQVIKR